MPLAATVRFAPPTEEEGAAGALIVPVAEDLAGLPATLGALLARAAPAGRFKGKARAVLDVIAPEGAGAERVLFLGLGPAGDEAFDWARLGGVAMGRLGAGRPARVLLTGADAAQAAEFGLGLLLRSYRFDLYKTKGAKRPGEAEEEGADGTAALTIHCADPAGAERAFAARLAVAEGVGLARDLVNEPPNVLFPEEFARRLEALRDLGVGVEVMDDEALEAAGMRALLAVARGSARGARVVVMRWEGGEAGAAPFAVVGKGVTFDSGGISIKPAGGMEDMKGDMAGAACVAGLMHALARRGARANVVGVVGLVENMPDGLAYRPGDVLTSLSGRTIEVINTDAEGRLVLADLLWHVKEAVKPSSCVNLATLTGAILVALGQENAGLFGTDDALCERLTAAGKAVGEPVWRLPLSDAYDKLIDSKVADMKNTGGRHAGSITAAQFLKRFTGDMPWAHLDIAGVGFGPAQGDLVQGFASGWGVRLLDRMIADHFEGS